MWPPQGVMRAQVDKRRNAVAVGTHAFPCVQPSSLLDCERRRTVNGKAKYPRVPAPRPVAHLDIMWRPGQQHFLDPRTACEGTHDLLKMFSAPFPDPVAFCKADHHAHLHSGSPIAPPPGYPNLASRLNVTSRRMLSQTVIEANDISVGRPRRQHQILQRFCVPFPAPLSRSEGENVLVRLRPHARERDAAEGIPRIRVVGVKRCGDDGTWRSQAMAVQYDTDTSARRPKTCP